MKHSVFLFGYLAFLDRIKPLLEMADEGDYKSVIEEVRHTTSAIESQNWILEDLGTTLRGFPDNFGDVPINQITGFALLVMLSQFLVISPISDPGFGNVAKAVSTLGWSEDDVNLLHTGMATTALLKPNSTLNVLERPSVSDSRWHDSAYYWWWVRPENAFYSGWWDLESIRSLADKLSSAQQDIEAINVENLKLHPSVSKAVLMKDYRDTIELFKLAVTSNNGLFYIIS